MKDTLIFILQKLVDHPEDIVVDDTKDGDSTVLTIHAHAEDIGKIIGKSGRIIKALRDIIKLMATKEQTYVDVVIAEPEQPQPVTE